MKKALMMIPVFALCMAGSAIAQTGKRTFSAEDRAKQMTDKMKTEIPLEEAQYSKVYELNLKYAQQMQEARKAAKDDQQNRGQSFQTMSKEREKELSQVLSDAQMKKYLELQKENRQKMHGNRRGQSPASK